MLAVAMASGFVFAPSKVAVLAWNEMATLATPETAVIELFHVVQGLGLDNAYGELAVGIAFPSTILTRGRAGARADRIGGKLCMQRGLLLYAVAGLICLLASWPQLPLAGSYAVLIMGRLLLGLGESVAMVGMINWAIGLMGQARSGGVMSLVGMGMYGAFAAGGPLGLALLNRIGFAGLMGVCTLLPLRSGVIQVTARKVSMLCLTRKIPRGHENWRR
jgi:MFS family permease